MKEDLITIIEYIKGFGKERRLILFTVLFFLCVGILNVVFSEKQYTSKTSFITKSSEGNKVSGGLKSIGNLIGLNLGNTNSSGGDLPLFLYPKIMGSIDYQRELMNTPIYLKKSDTTLTIKQYYTNVSKPNGFDLIKKYTLGLPNLLLNALKPPSTEHRKILIDSIGYISKEEQKIIKELEKVIAFGVDDVDGSIYLSATFPEPFAAAQITDRSRDLLQNKIVEYRILKATQEFDFINERYQEKKAAFYEAQSKLAHYSDRNSYNSTQKSLVTRERLQQNYNIASIAYSEIENQKILKAIQVQEDTPAFVTLQPAIAPIKPTNKSSIVILIKYVLIGFIVSVLIYIIKIFNRKIREFLKTV